MGEKRRKDGSLKRKNMFGNEGTCPECKIGCGTCFGAGLSNAPREALAEIERLREIIKKGWCRIDEVDGPLAAREHSHKA